MAMTEYMDGYVETPYPKKKRRRWPVILLLLLLAAGSTLVGQWAKEELLPGLRLLQLEGTGVPEWVDQQIIGVDGSSRRGQMLEGVRSIVIHYVGNPGTTAQQNHDWYENPASEVSSHFVVGLEGEVIQCIPLDEKSSATNWRNKDTISIEVCHEDESGEFNDQSYDALVKLTAWLLDSCGLTEQEIIRHYDVTGKECPRYYVRNPDAWDRLRADVAAYKKEAYE